MFLKPVQEATPWINSFVLVEGNDQHGQPKFQLCLDPSNLNKAIVQEPYHFQDPGRHSTPTSGCHHADSPRL